MYFEIKNNILKLNYLIKNIYKIIILYLFFRFKIIKISNKKKIVEIDNKINEDLYENNIDFSNYSTSIKIISIYFPEFLFNKKINYSNKKYELIKNQVNLAKSHGVYGFAIYYYWLSGKKIYNEAINLFLENKEINFPFLIIWKNDNYEMNINIINKSLIKQEYNENEPLSLIKDIKKYLISENYIKIKEKPVLGIYNYTKILQITNFINNLRKEALNINIGEIYILGNINKNEDYSKIKIFDFNFEIPLININLNKLFYYKINNNYSNLIYFDNFKYQINSKNFNIFYNKIFEFDYDNINNIFFDFNKYFKKKLFIFFKIFINYINDNYNKNNRFIIINGWNNFKERIYLEPDENFGYSSLNLLSKALFNLSFHKNNFNLENLKIKSKIAVQAHIFYEDLIFDIINIL